ETGNEARLVGWVDQPSGTPSVVCLVELHVAKILVLLLGSSSSNHAPHGQDKPVGRESHIAAHNDQKSHPCSCIAACTEKQYAYSAQDPLRCRQRSSHYLIHIVVAILRQTTNKGYALLGICQRGIALIKRFTGITWHWVIRIPIRLRVFTHDGCTRMLLSGQMFELSNTCIGMIIGVVDRTDRLELVSISQVLMLEA